jgi:hypothetical protein
MLYFGLDRAALKDAATRRNVQAWGIAPGIGSPSTPKP